MKPAKSACAIKVKHDSFLIKLKRYISHTKVSNPCPKKNPAVHEVFYNPGPYFGDPCTLRPRQNGRHFPDDIFKWIFLNENVWISIKISLKFVPKGLINNIPALVQIMAWRRPGDKPLSEPIMVSLPTHICVTRPQWVNFNGWWVIARTKLMFDTHGRTHRRRQRMQKLDSGKN